MDRAHQRGPAKVQVPADLTGIVQHLKGLTTFFGRREGREAQQAIAEAVSNVSAPVRSTE